MGDDDYLTIYEVSADDLAKYFRRKHRGLDRGPLMSASQIYKPTHTYAPFTFSLPLP